jgi:hypothetical protein
MHALHYVEKATGGRGQKGGLSAYAEAVGKSEGTIRPYRLAAEVMQNLVSNHEVSAYLDKAAHLAAIHKLPSRSRSPCNARTVTSCRWDKFWDTCRTCPEDGDFIHLALQKGDLLPPDDLAHRGRDCGMIGMEAKI